MVGYQMYDEKDTYYITLVAGGHKNNYNNGTGHGKPSKPGKPSPQGGTGHNHNNYDVEDNSDDNHSEQNHHPPQQGALQPAPPPPPPGAYAGAAYSTPYPCQCPPPPPSQNQLAVGGYHHVTGYPGSSFVPHQGGYGNHGGSGAGRRKKDVGLLGAAMGLVTFGLFKLLGKRRRHDGRY